MESEVDHLDVAELLPHCRVPISSETPGQRARGSRCSGNPDSDFGNRFNNGRSYVDPVADEYEVEVMNRFHCALAAAAVAFTVLAPEANAGEVALTIEPACPYGYYDAYPYSCAPYGYYGPEWFIGGVFVGAGPWFHGPRDFHGHVDNRFDVRRGYRGTLPTPGERRDEARRLDRIEHFQANEMRDGHGEVGGHRR